MRSARRTRNDIAGPVGSDAPAAEADRAGPVATDTDGNGVPPAIVGPSHVAAPSSSPVPLTEQEAALLHQARDVFDRGGNRRSRTVNGDVSPNRAARLGAVTDRSFEGPRVTIEVLLARTLADVDGSIGVFSWPTGSAFWTNRALAERLADETGTSRSLVDVLAVESRDRFQADALPELMFGGTWRGLLSLQRADGTVELVVASLVSHQNPEGITDALSMFALPVEDLAGADFLAAEAGRLAERHRTGVSASDTTISGNGIGPTTGGHATDEDPEQVWRHQEERLTKMMEDEGVCLRYQPIVDMATRRTVGVEALLRVRGDGGELQSPATFVGEAESAGLIARLGIAVLRSACRQIGALGSDAAHLHLSVNVSPRQVAAPGFAANVLEVLEETTMAASRLHLEISEGVPLGEGDVSDNNIIVLREAGVRIGLDEFGGETSLSYLRRYPLDFVKIDRSLIGGLGANYVDGALVRTTVELAHKLGLTAVAVGVETEQQYQRLVQLGCHQAQGYLFGGVALPDELIGR